MCALYARGSRERSVAVHDALDPRFAFQGVDVLSVVAQKLFLLLEQLDEVVRGRRIEALLREEVLADGVERVGIASKEIKVKDGLRIGQVHLAPDAFVETTGRTKVGHAAGHADPCPAHHHDPIGGSEELHDIIDRIACVGQVGLSALVLLKSIVDGQVGEQDLYVFSIRAVDETFETPQQISVSQSRSGA